MHRPTVQLSTNWSWQYRTINNPAFWTDPSSAWLHPKVVDSAESSLGALIRKILARNASHGSPYLLLTYNGKRVTAAMLRHRWDDAREEAVKEAVSAGDQVLAGKISQFQFRDIRPKAASEIADVDHASLLLGHTKGDITERVYRRIGALAKPTK